MYTNLQVYSSNHMRQYSPYGNECEVIAGDNDMQPPLFTMMGFGDMASLKSSVL